MEWLRASGLSYREMEKGGYGFVVVEARVFYRRAARFDDELLLSTTLAEARRASLRFEYRIGRDGEEVCSGYTRHGCIDLATGRPSRIPPGIVAAGG